VGEEHSFGCVSTDVFGAVLAGLAVFKAPPDITGSAFRAFSYGAGLAATNVGSAVGRTNISVALLIAGLLIGASAEVAPPFGPAAVWASKARIHDLGEGDTVGGQFSGVIGDEIGTDTLPLILHA
jgi:hypothetical protein